MAIADDSMIRPTSVGLCSLQEYLTTDFKPDVEYLDGKLQERNVGEWDHGRLQALLLAYLINRECQWNIVVIPEQRVQIAPTRFRIPDIAVLTSVPDEQILTKPPFLCIEILSPEDRMGRLLAKVGEYLSFGVNFVWIVDPKTRQAFVYSPDGVSVVADNILRTYQPDIMVPLDKLGI